MAETDGGDSYDPETDIIQRLAMAESGEGPIGTLQSA